MPVNIGTLHPRRDIKVWNTVLKLYDVQGLSFREIGLKLGISRQRAHQVYHNAKAEEARQHALKDRT